MKITRAGASALLLVLFFDTGCTTHRSTQASNGASVGGSVIRQVLLVEPTSLDPANVPDVTTAQIIQHTFEGLTRFNTSNNIEPCLAESWDVSPDGKTYTFHLRKNVKFHNGRVFVADDVKYSWERALNPHTASAQAANYLAGISGLKECSTGKSSELTGVKVLDPNTLQVSLDGPQAYFTGMITMPQDYVVCKEEVEKTGGKVTEKSFVGTGAFKFESYQPGQQVNLTSFADYWGGKPKCSRVEMPVILDQQTAYDNYLTNRIDIYPDMPGVLLAQDRERKRMQAEYHVSPYALISYIGFQQNRQPAFKNPDVRRAFAMAIDREEIVRVAFKSVATVASGVIPDGVPMRGALPEPLHYDAAGAKTLLAKAGYPGGKGFPALTLSYVQKDSQRESEAVIVRRNLKDNLGIDVSLSAREAGDFYETENKHGLELWLGGWVADYLDPQDFLSTLFLTGAPLNFFDYHNEKFDALCREADAGLDAGKRQQLYSEAHSLLIHDMAVVPIYFGPRISLVHSNIKGWRECALYTLPNTLTTKD